MNQQGFSIVEFMIASSLGLALTLGLIGFFIANKHTYQLSTGFAQLQENARFADLLLKRQLRATGLQGCAPTSKKEPLNLITNPGDALTFTEQSMVQGYDANGTNYSPSLPSWLTTNLASGTSIKAGTDVIVTKTMESNTAYLTANMAASDSNITVANKINFQAGDIVFITDCEDTNIFKASTGTSSTNLVHGAADNTTTQLSKAFQTDAQVGRLQTLAYYIKDTGRTNQDGNAVFALYQQDINGNETELVEGIDELQLSYGVDTTGNKTADSYLTAAEVNNANQWDSIISINVTMLVTSVEPANDKATSYTFQGVTQTPSDRLLRQQWDSFITLRNRSLP